MIRNLMTFVIFFAFAHSAYALPSAATGGAATGLAPNCIAEWTIQFKYESGENATLVFVGAERGSICVPDEQGFPKQTGCFFIFARTGPDNVSLESWSGASPHSFDDLVFTSSTEGTFATRGSNAKGSFSVLYTSMLAAARKGRVSPSRGNSAQAPVPPKPAAFEIPTTLVGTTVQFLPNQSNSPFVKSAQAHSLVCKDARRGEMLDRKGRVVDDTVTTYEYKPLPPNGASLFVNVHSRGTDDDEDEEATHSLSFDSANSGTYSLVGANGCGRFVIVSSEPPKIVENPQAMPATFRTSKSGIRSFWLPPHLENLRSLCKNKADSIVSVGDNGSLYFGLRITMGASKIWNKSILVLYTERAQLDEALKSVVSRWNASRKSERVELARLEYCTLEYFSSGEEAYLVATPNGAPPWAPNDISTPSADQVQFTLTEVKALQSLLSDFPVKN